MVNWRSYHSPRRGGLVTALDIGSSKVYCAIAQVHHSGTFEIIGVGHQLSSGLKAGVVIDMEEVITSIVNAVHTAEKMAGVTVREVVANVNGTHLKSINYAVEMTVSGHPIDDGDIRRALSQTKSIEEDPTWQPLHTFPIGYGLDGSKGIQDPRGMHGDRLRVSIHTLMSKTSPLYNLNSCISRSHLEVSGFVASPYASGLSSLVEDEMSLGAVIVDMGGSTTSFAVFHEGQLRYVGCIPMGGSHITRDVAHCFSTTLANAERLKTLYGSALPSASEDREMIVVPQVGEKRGEGTNQMERAALGSVIKPRIEEIFEHVRIKLTKAGVDLLGGQRVVLTGGASQLAGVREVATRILGKNVRLGKPLHLGSSELSQDPSFSACAGLLFYGQAEHLSYLQSMPESKSKRAFMKVSSFLKQIW